MDSAFMDSYIPALRATGGYNDIYDSLDSDDLADVVRVAVDALDKSHKISAVNKTFKSAEESIKLREQGNVHYVNGEHKQAILCYNKALAFAPMNSLEMIMAYSNTSAVMLTIKAYQACQMNIKACFDLGCPQFLKDKLDKRMMETTRFIMEEMTLCFGLFTDFRRDFVKFNVTRNSEVPCASDDICVQNNEGIMKAVASRDIKAGTMVAMERAFVSTHTGPNQYTSCSYCHMMCFFFVPCGGCQALFCSVLCRNSCMEEYHRIECHIVDILGTMCDKSEVQLTTRATIKMSLKLGWEELSVASQEIGAKRLKKSTVKEAFDVSNPVSILSYDDQKAVFPGRIFNGSIICGTIVRCLSTVPGYFPEDLEKRKKAIDAISRIMLHLYATFTNRIDILCTAYDYHSRNMETVVQSNLGWFSFTSKLAHSCEPNLYVMGLNKQVALVALQRIKKGEELTISYIEHYYDMLKDYEKHSMIRQKKIFSAIQYLCECRVCVQEWHAISTDSAAVLTYRQNKIFEEFKAKVIKFEYSFKDVATAVDGLTGLTYTSKQGMVYNRLKIELAACQLVKKFNKAYETEWIMT